MSTDQELISNLLRNITPTTSNEFAHVDWIQINDMNNLNYNNGNIRLDSINQRDMWINWKDSFLMMPIVIYGTTPLTIATNNPPNVALKNGVAQLIYSLQLTINNEKINNTDNLNRYHAIKQMVEDSYSYQSSRGGMYHLAKDNVDSADPAEFLYDANAPYPVVSRNTVAYNDGFYKRIQFIKGTYKLPTGGTRGYWTFRVIVPLALISGFFKELDIPLFNCRVTMNIGVTDLIPNANATAIMGDLAAVNAAGALTMAIGSGVAGYNLCIEPSCRLYLPQVIFSAKTAGLLATMINSGFTKTVTFYDTKTILNTKVTAAANGVNQVVSMPLTPGIIAPMKLWLTATPANSENSNAHPSPVQATGTFTGVNILIDGKRHYSTDLMYDFEFYQLLRKEFCNGGDETDTQSGSLISYNDFVNGNQKYYVFDISRSIRSQLALNPLKTFSLSLQATVKEAAAFDIYTHIEYEVVVTINMSTGIVKTYGSN